MQFPMRYNRNCFIEVPEVSKYTIHLHNGGITMRTPDQQFPHSQKTFPASDQKLLSAKLYDLKNLHEYLNRTMDILWKILVIHADIHQMTQNVSRVTMDTANKHRHQYQLTMGLFQSKRNNFLLKCVSATSVKSWDRQHLNYFLKLHKKYLLHSRPHKRWSLFPK